MGLTKAQLEALNVSSFPNNNTGLITPEILRDYNSASIANTVNQDAYTTDSASFNSRIDSIVTGTGFVTTSSFNAYTSSQLTINTGYNTFTQSADGRLDNLEATTSSLNSSVTQLNANTASQQSSINQLNASSASQQSQINSLISATGSYITTPLTSLNAYTASNDTKWNNLAGQSGSWITESETGSFATSAITASSLITASISGQTLTFTKGDASTFNITLPSGSGGSTDITALNAFTASQLTINSGYNTTTASLLIETANLETFSASTLTRLTNIETTTASLNSSVSQLNANTASQQSQIDSLIAATGSYSTSSADVSSLNAYTASNDTKWSNLGAQSGSWITESETGSFANATTFNQYTASNDDKVNQLISATGSYAISASVAAVDAAQQSQINQLIAVTASFQTSSTDITQLNAFTASQQALNGTFATTGSNTFTGQQTLQNNLAIEQPGNPLIYSLISQDALDGKLRFAQFGGTGIQFNGLDVIMNELTASLTEGYTWVGNNAGQTSLVATSSFGTPQIPLTSLNAFTASQLNINSGYNTFTQSADQRLDSIESVSGSWITESETASFARTNVDNNFTANQTFTNITAVSASFTYVQTLYETSSVIYSSGSNQFGDELTDIQTLSGSVKVQGSLTVNGTPVLTSSVDISGLTTTASFNSYTSSNDAKVNSLIAATGSYATTGSNSFTGSQTITGSILATDNIRSNNYLIGINGVQTNLITLPGGAGDITIDTAFNPTGEILLNSNKVSVSSNLVITGSLTASLQEGYVWVGGVGNISKLVATSSFGSTIDTGSFATTGSNAFFGTNTFSGAVSFTGSAPSILSQSFSGSLITNLTDTYTDVAAVQQIVTLTSASYAALASGSLTNPNTLYIVSGSTSGTTIDTGSFATTGSNTFTGVNTFNDNVFITASKELKFGDNTSIFKSLDGITGFHTYGGNQTRNFTSGEMLILQEANAQFLIENKAGNVIKISGSATSIQDVDFIPFSSSLDSRINAITTIDTGSFATTGSNQFIGDQTINGNVRVQSGSVVSITGQDTDGRIIMLGHSGSLLLSNNSVTSTYASLSHISSSQPNANTNIIFKTNNNTADTIVSGSGNLFVNPAAATSGFKRYIGGSGNVMLNASNVPQISGSMTFSPTMNNNMFGGNSQTMTMRGPVSSSAWTISSNSFLGSATVGQTAANHAQGLVSGFTMTGNYQNGVTTIIANKANLTQPTTLTNNNIGGTLSLTAASSSISWIGSTTQGNVTLTNTVSGSGATVVSASNGVYNSQNIVGGQLTINATGNALSDDPTGQSFLRSFERNIIGGNGNIVSLNGDTTSTLALVSTAIIGNNLTITGSSASQVFNTAGVINYGSAFFGRYNAQDGNKAKSGETVFAVGTGTGTSSRKTGFLIDSGSNTFIEGTLNVSGSTSLQGTTTFIDRSGTNNNNVYLGTSALLDNTTGVANVAIGQAALQFNTTGNNNFALGVNALQSNIDGNGNFAAGVDAGRNASGSSNVFIGVQSGQYVTGSSNTIIGGYAGVTGSVLNNNIILADGVGNVKAQYSGSAWSFQDEIKLNKGSNKPADIVTVGTGGSLTVSNSLVTVNSIILVTTQDRENQADEYPAVVGNKTTGAFDIFTNVADTVQVAYLIINPTA